MMSDYGDPLDHVNAIDVDSTTMLGRLAIASMNAARRMGEGVRERTGDPVLLAVDGDGGEILVCPSRTGARVLWLCWNRSVSEIEHYLATGCTEPRAWRNDLAAKLAPWHYR